MNIQIEAVRSYDGTYYLNMMIEGNHQFGLPEYVSWKELKKHIKEYYYFDLPNVNSLNFTGSFGKSYAYWNGYYDVVTKETKEQTMKTFNTKNNFFEDKETTLLNKRDDLVFGLATVACELDNIEVDFNDMEQSQMFIDVTDFVADYLEEIAREQGGQ